MHSRPGLSNLRGGPASGCSPEPFLVDHVLLLSNSRLPPLAVCGVAESRTAPHPPPAQISELHRPAPSCIPYQYLYTSSMSRL